MSFFLSAIVALSVGLSFLLKPREAHAQSRGQVKLLSLNVGGADFHFSGWFKIEPMCPVFKLCDPGIVTRVHRHITQHQPDVVHLQEVLAPSQLTNGTAEAPALLPKGYLFVCASGAGQLKEVCLAWNKHKAKLKAPCHTISSYEGGSIKCTLEVDGMAIDFINIHPSAWFKKDQQTIIRYTWNKLVTPGHPTVMAGDFNTELETYKPNGDKPYPAEFGTVFGRMVKNYGRWPNQQSSFGKYIVKPNGQKGVREYRGTTVFFDKIDHIFANFGDQIAQVPLDSMPCRQAVCLGNHDGYEWGSAEWSFFSSWGPKTDHLPILALISWKRPGPRQ